MAKKADELIIDSLSNNWQVNHAPSAGTTCTASVQPTMAGSHERLHLTQLGWSIRNVSAAAYTATLSVRDATIGGAVLGTWDIVIASNTGLQDSWAVNMIGLKGNALNIDFGTPAASVTQKVSAAGWRNQSAD